MISNSGDSGSESKVNPGTDGNVRRKLFSNPPGLLDTQIDSKTTKVAMTVAKKEDDCSATLKREKRKITEELKSDENVKKVRVDDASINFAPAADGSATVLRARKVVKKPVNEVKKSKKSAMEKEKTTDGTKLMKTVVTGKSKAVGTEKTTKSADEATKTKLAATKTKAAHTSTTKKICIRCNWKAIKVAKKLNKKWQKL